MRSAAELAYRRTSTYRTARRRDAFNLITHALMVLAGFAAGVMIALH